MSIASKLEYLDGTKDYIRQCIQQKGVTVPSGTTFRQYGDKILEIETEQHPPGWEGEGGEGGEAKLTAGVATATGQEFILTPPEDYDGFNAVTVTGDYNLKPENIAEGITIYGVTGTMAIPKNTSNIPSAYLDLFEQAKQMYGGDYKNLMILESDDTVAFGFLLDNFNVTDYDKQNTEFYASGWVYVAYNKKTGSWKVEPWENSSSNGNSYCKNIRYCDMYVYYGDLLIYPILTLGPSLDVDTMTMLITPCKTGGSPFELSNPNSISMYICGTNLTINFGDGFEYNNRTWNSETRIVHTYEENKEYMMTITGSLYSLRQIIASNLKFLTPLSSTVTQLRALLSNSWYTGTDYWSDKSSVRTIPSDLFSKLTFTDRIIDISLLFREQNWLQSIPDGLFDNLVNVTTIADMCLQCRNLSYIPKDLFRGMTKLKNASGAFQNCNILNCDLDGLFTNCNEATNFNLVFEYCYELLSLPDRMFPSDPKFDVSYNNAFQGCTKLTHVSNAFFHNLKRPSAIISMFSRCDLSYIPPIWDTSIFGTTFTSIDHRYCFQSNTHASNWSEVPEGWR